MKSTAIQRMVALTTLIGIMGTGCGKSHTDSDPDSSQQYSDGKYQAAACQFASTEGGSVDPNYANASNITATYFGKSFDFAPVQAVMGASVQNTVDFFNANHGVRVFKVDTPNASCKPFAALPSVSSDFKNLWDQASGGVGSGMSLVGLYINKDSDNAPSSQASAEIGVREDANRWVVVHEFMHSRFDAYVNAHAISSNELKRNFSAHLEQLNAYKNAADTDPVAVRGMTTLFVTLNQEMSEIIRRYYLEEVTIETFLQLHYSQFSFMPEMIDSSNAYIAVSAKKAGDQLDKMNSGLVALSKLAANIQLNDVSNSASSELLANANLQNEISRTLMLTDAYYTSAGSVMNTNLKNTDDHSSNQFNCGHDHDLEKITQKFNKVISKIAK